MSDKRQKNQLELAFASRSEASALASNGLSRNFRAFH